MSNRTDQRRYGAGWRRVIAVLLACGLPGAAFAQLAPVIGGHHAARSSDTGFTGATNAVGAYSASVPLDLPESRGGLPVPVQVVHGGNQVGAAGLGWDVPLSTIVRSKSLAHRRPKPGTFPDPDAPPSTDPLPLPESLTLTLGGARTDLILNAEGTAWVARNDAQLEVRASGDSTLLVYDGNGLTYQFSSQGAAAGSRLDNGNLYLLRSITGPAGRVVLEYNFGAPALPGGGTGLSIDLRSVAYNQSEPNSGCFKHKIQLNYDGPAASPLSMSILGSTVLARTQKLLSISVGSRPTCSGAEVSLRRYDFTYQTDPDTQRPQLQKVTMVGQQGTPERNVTLPVASYGYGSLTDANGAITFQKTQSISLPGAGTSVFSHGISYTAATPTNDPKLTWLETTQAIVDLDGDGRPELVTNAGGSPDAGVYRNLPSSVRGQSSFVNIGGTYAPGPASSEVDSVQNPPKPYHYKYQAWHEQSPYAFAKPARSYSNTWSQYVDVNADGRMDFVNARYQDYWLVAINTPDPANPKNSVFVGRQIPLAPIRKALGARHGGGPIPLSRTLTVATQGALRCFGLTEFEGWVTALKDQCPGMNDALQAHAQAQASVTLWELKDINGDGYPDFVYDAGPDLSNDSPVPEPAEAGSVGSYVLQQGAGIDLTSPRPVEVLYNSMGVHVANADAGGDHSFEERTALGSGCGLTRWEAVPGDALSEVLYQTCGLEDVNGDGIADRVTSEVVPAVGGGQTFQASAALGTGNPGNPFADAKIVLPGPLSSVHTDMRSSVVGPVPVACDIAPDGSYDTLRAQALRDINGDGLPDYISQYSGAMGQWSVSFGTGTGFTTLRTLNVPAGLELGREFSSCPDGDGISGTDAGLYDLDGDGQPELVNMNFSATTLDVYQLKSPIPQFEIGGFASVPQAGRLIRIDNGYGVATRLSYQSAKVDPYTHHNVPSPEIVVGAELTTLSSTPGVYKAQPIHHAYGEAVQVFDSVQDRFVFPGYRRTVTMVGTQAGSPPKGLVTITDTYGLAPFVPGSDATARLKRYSTTGRISDVTTLSADIDGNDPWQFLTVNIANDARRISGAHYDWDARLLASGQATGLNEACVEMTDPYDYTKSLQEGLAPNDECVRRGFAFQKEVFSWRGAPGTADPHVVSSTVQTGSTVEAIDDLGRITQVHDLNDRMIASDDLCTQTTYADPVSTVAGPRVLNAPQERTVTNCASTPLTLSKSTWEYDQLPVGQVGNGFVTAQVASRLDENGQPLPDATGESDIRLFDATHDAFGNVLTMTRTRDDGAVRTESFAYDPFKLVATTATTTASGGIPPQMASVELDAITLNPLNTTDPNGTQRGALYDGFGRVLQTLVTPTGGSEGALSSMSYLGFAVGETGGRRVEQKVFTDPVAPASVATAAGRTGTTYLDELGRPSRTEVQLGADYDSRVMVVGRRLYDLQGRVEFQADPYPKDEPEGTAYGTTWKFNADGTPRCAIRGRGKQALTEVANEAQEIYPTCSTKEYLDNKALVRARDASSNLPGSGQEGVQRALLSNATGQVLSDWTLGSDGQLISNMKFGYDALGRRTTLTRYRDAALSGDPVTTTWHYDSFGQVVRLEEPGAAPQFRNYDSWGQLVRTQWTDGATTKSSESVYDALGRLVHSEDRNNQVAIPATVKDFIYDQAFSNATPAVTATNVLGRLSKAISDTSSVFFSYDGLGRVNAQVFSDKTVSPAKLYVQKNQYHGDGSPQAVHLMLSDRNFPDERVDYGYDSAARLVSVTYTDGTTRDLFKAVSNDVFDPEVIDVFGRIRQAQYGPARFNASFAETGRRLIEEVKVTTPSLKSRRIAFAPVQDTSADKTPFDPMGRERARQEYVDGVLKKSALFSYDNLGRLSAFTSQNPFFVSTFTYDSLGNLTHLTDGENFPDNAATMSYQATDRDRICSIGYDDNLPPAACNVSYDAAGNIMAMPTRNGTERRFSYFPGGQVGQIIQGNSVATYDYDAFGAVQRLVLNSTTSSDIRNQDKYFGSMMAQRREGGILTNLRTIPLPGAIATRHGPNGNWTFAFSESRGTRFVTDENGEFVQTTDYQPFGEVKDPTGAVPSETDYTREQWNGGDFLAAFGINRLGARLYDPVIGRFLSRDPVFDGGNGYNPYAFAANDPINNADPTGTRSSTGAKYCNVCSLLTWLRGSQFIASGYEVVSGGGGADRGGRDGFFGRSSGYNADFHGIDGYGSAFSFVGADLFQPVRELPQLTPNERRYKAWQKVNELRQKKDNREGGSWFDPTEWGIADDIKLLKAESEQWELDHELGLKPDPAPEQARQDELRWLEGVQRRREEMSISDKVMEYWKARIWIEKHRKK